MFVDLRNTNTTDAEFSRKKDMLREYNRVLKQTIRNAKKMYYTSCFKMYKGDIKKTWQAINNIINKKNISKNHSEYFLVNNEEISDSSKIANEFNNFFCKFGQWTGKQINTNCEYFFLWLLENPCK